MNTQTAAATGTTYKIDPSHTGIGFTVRHLMIAKVRGRFAAFEGTIVVPEGSTLPSAVNVTIDAKSLDTREEQRDNHLRSADFLEVEKYPALTFTSKRTEGTGENFKLIGDLTIHGVTREVVLDATYEGTAKDPWGGTRIAYGAHTTINRKDYGLTWNAALETGGVVVGDEVKIELEIEAVAQ